MSSEGTPRAHAYRPRTTAAVAIAMALAWAIAALPGCPRDSSASAKDSAEIVEPTTDPEPTGPWAGTHVVLAPYTPLYRDTARTQLEVHLGIDPVAMRLEQRSDGGLSLSTRLAPGLHCYDDLEGLGQIDVRLFAAEEAALEVNVARATGTDGDIAIEFAPGAAMDVTVVQTAEYELAVPTVPETGRTYTPAPPPGDRFDPLTLLNAGHKLVPIGLGEPGGGEHGGGDSITIAKLDHAHLGDEELQLVHRCVMATIPLTPEQREAIATNATGLTIPGIPYSGNTLAAGSPLYWSDGTSAGSVPEQAPLPLLLTQREGTDRLCGEPGDPMLDGLDGLFGAETEPAPPPGPAGLDRTLELCVDREAVVQPQSP
ncbi:MAG: hypothetical protein JRI25_25815 [Deltaproteobacteria bacterium]|nr:hypothetical protein [Deltaproteobacteria bacterium]